MRSSGMSIDVLTKYVELFRQGKDTAGERKNLLIEQRNKLLKKQEEIQATIQRLDYKIKIYTEIVEGKRKDFLEEP